MSNKDTMMELKMCEKFTDFDKILSKTWCKTDSDKLFYLNQLFDVNVVHSMGGTKHDDYIAVANAVMNFA